MNLNRIADAHQASAYRIASFDLARGMAVVFMIFVHVLHFYGQQEVRSSALGGVVDFFGRAPAAPVFMFIMGVLVARSKTQELLSGLMRAAGLFFLGYVLNLVRGSIPMWLSLKLGRVSYEELNGYTPVTEFLIIDILQFAGIALAVCLLLRKFFPSPLLWVVLALLVTFTSPNLWPLFSGLSYLDGILILFWGGKHQGSMFPLFPWLAYPLAGMAFGFWFSKYRGDIKRFYWFSVGLGAAMILLGSGIILTDMVFELAGYVRSRPGLVIWNMGFVLLWLAWCHLLVKVLNTNPVLNLFYFWSKHITVIYVIQWIVIGWVTIIVGIGQLGYYPTLVAMLGVLLASDLLLRLWLSLNKEAKSIASV